MQYSDRPTSSSNNWKDRLQSIAEKNKLKDRGFDKYIGRFSRFIWPLSEKWLVLLSGILCLMDFSSTYIDLSVIHNPDVVESGPMAGWALGVGGFGFLFIVDIFVVSAMVGIALTARYLYSRSGLKGYARAAFIVLLLPYIVRTVIAVIGNLAIAFH